jgi:hypothetical protein
MALLYIAALGTVLLGLVWYVNRFDVTVPAIATKQPTLYPYYGKPERPLYFPFTEARGERDSEYTI